MGYGGIALLDLLTTAAGLCVLAGFGFVRGRRGVLGALGLAYLAGWMTVGLVLSLVVIAGGTASPAWAVGAHLLVAAAGLGAARLVAPARRPVRRGDGGFLPVVASVVAAALTATLAAGLFLRALAQGSSNRWDAWAFWTPKAKIVASLGLTTGPGGFTSFAHADYPPLLTVMQAATFRFAGTLDTSVLPVQEAVLFVSFLAALAWLLHRRVPAHVLWPCLLLATTLPRWAAGVGWTLGDQPMGMAAALGAVALVLWQQEGDPRLAVLGATSLAAATLVKKEGLSIALLVAIAAVLCSGRALRGRWRPALLVVAAPVLVILPWKLWLSVNNVHAGTDYDASLLLHPHYLGQRIDRWTTTLQTLKTILFDTGWWSVAAPLFLAAIALGLLGGARRTAIFSLLVLVVGFFGLSTVYWVSPNDLHWYLGTSADRAIGTLVAISVSLLPLLIGEMLRPRRRAAG